MLKFNIGKILTPEIFYLIQELKFCIRFINFMQKKQSKQLTSLPSLLLYKDKSKILNRRYQRQAENSIPSIQQAFQREKNLVKLHKWRQQGKFFKLQETYDENCRIFVSLNKQKSYYQIVKKKTLSKKKVYFKLTPLTERNNKQLTQAEIGTDKKTGQIYEIYQWQK